MPRSFVVFIGTFVAVFAAANIYVGLRTWQTLGDYLPFSGTVFGLLWALLAAIPIIGRIGRLFAKGLTNKIVALAGGYWLAITYYAFLVWLCADILSWLAVYLLPVGAAPLSPYMWGLLPWSVVVLLMFYGTWNAIHPVVNRYQVTIAKSAGELRQLTAVLVSDIHLGPIVDNRRLETLVRRINELKPDVVFFAGDTIDENVAYFTTQQMTDSLRRLQTNYGAFAVLGNHEYIGGQAAKAAQALSEAGLKVLRDSWITVADSVYIVGRDEKSRGRFTGVPRARLAAILADIDRSLPIILLDHQPVDHGEAVQAGVDLQLSGHTHRGQFFPNNLVTRRVFAVDWGYLRIQSLQIIVSSGYGTWGPPIRIGNRPELVHITIDFTG